MSWWGKLFGGTFGYMLGGPLGGLIGAALGHNFDARLKKIGEPSGFRVEQERIQMAFFTATFSVMGHLAKADGQVSRDEIRLAQAVMDQMHLSPELKKLAQKLFNEGKQSGFALEEVLDQFRDECHRRQTLLRVFIEVQLQAAYADGHIHPSERRLLVYICEKLGFSKAEFDHLETLVRAGTNGAAGGDGQSGRRLNLEKAYQMLNVPVEASDAEVKKAYRRLLSQHHPDKLVAKGLPEEMMKLAAQKTHEIRSAYERIREARGF